MVGGDRVEHAAVDGEGLRSRFATRVSFPGERCADVAAGDPQAAGYAGSRAREQRRDAIGVARLEQPDAAHPYRGVAEVGVGVDEAGEEHAAPEVDDARVRPGERHDLPRVAHGGDAVVAHREGLGLRARGVYGPDATAAEDEVG